MLSLKSFHLFLIALCIIVTAAIGVWGLLDDARLLGGTALAVSGALVVYFAYFGAGAERIRLK